MVLGWGVLFAFLVVAIPLGVVMLPLVLLGLGVGALVWNFATAALLPVALDDRLGFWRALRLGMSLSWHGKGRWWCRSS